MSQDGMSAKLCTALEIVLTGVKRERRKDNPTEKLGSGWDAYSLMRHNSRLEPHSAEFIHMH